MIRLACEGGVIYRKNEPPKLCHYEIVYRRPISVKAVIHHAKQTGGFDCPSCRRTRLKAYKAT